MGIKKIPKSIKKIPVGIKKIPVGIKKIPPHKKMSINNSFRVYNKKVINLSYVYNRKVIERINYELRNGTN